MRVALLATGVLFLFSRVLCASTVHVIGIEDIPKLMASSDLVCKGEVVEAAEPVFSAALELPRRTSTAVVRADRCFKGQWSGLSWSELPPLQSGHCGLMLAILWPSVPT